MELTIAERVELGSQWLDAHYPDWWKVIDLGTLELSSCSECVLGQVYTGCIPDAERNQLLAQVAASAYPESTSLRDTYINAVRSGETGGFNVLVDEHGIFGQTDRLGFNVTFDASHLSDKAEYAALTDEWTRVILSRRLAEDPEANELTQRLDPLRDLVHI